MSGTDGEAPAPPPPPTATIDMQAAVETAQAQHLEWQENLSRALLWPADAAARTRATDETGGFAGWVSRHRDNRLVDQPTILEAADLDFSMRRDAERLLADSVDGEIPRGRFDSLMRRAAIYHGRLMRLARAFATASAELDPLTGLHNRATLQRLFHREQARLLRSDGVSGVAIADLDNFKQINDQLGHAAGDAVLRHAADMLTTRLRPYDVVFRYGGEEFLILFPDSDLQTAGLALERLRRTLTQHPAHLPDGRTQPVTASFGAAEFDGETEWAQVVARADAALYRAKEGGRNRVELWQAGDPEPTAGGNG